MSLNDKLMKKFESETGEKPTYIKNGATFHTLKYVDWLESSIEKSVELPPVEEIIERVHNDIKTWNATVTQYPLWVAAIRMAYDVIASRIDSKGVENGKD